jgi:hypothetical protein
MRFRLKTGHVECDYIKYRIQVLYLYIQVSRLTKFSFSDFRRFENPLPELVLKPVLKSSLNEQALFHCPLFLTKSRRFCVGHIYIPSDNDFHNQVVSGAAIVLRRGKLKKAKVS